VRSRGNLLPLQRRNWDVVVAGAGPAGTMSALEFVRAGYTVLLVDRSVFPRAKVCGGCLNMAAVKVLQDAGLVPVLQHLGARPLSQLIIVSKDRQFSVPLPGGYAVSRSGLDAALVDAAQQEGVHFLSGVRAGLEEVRSDGCSIVLTSRFSSQTVRASIAVCADGLSGTFLARHAEFAPKVRPSSRIGISCVSKVNSVDPPAGVVRMVVDDEGYVGMVQVEEGSLNLAAAITPGAIIRADKSPFRALRRILEPSGIVVPKELSRANWRGTVPLTRVRPVVGAGRLLIIGDAAGYVEPFTGEGMAWALSCGRLVVSVVRQLSQSRNNDLGRAWQQVYGESVARRQRVCRIVQRILRKPGLYRRVLHFSARNSFWARRVISSLNRPVYGEVSNYES